MMILYVSLLTVSSWCGPLQSDLLPSWIEGLATLGAAGIAGLGLLYVRRTWRATKDQLRDTRQQLNVAEEQLRIERDRESRQDQTTLRGQADQIAGWLQVAPGPVVSSDPKGMDMFLVNASRQPVYRAQAHIQIGATLVKRFEVDTLAPWPTGMHPILVSGANPDEVPRMQQARENGQPHGMCFTFRDVHGNDWTRRWDGTLVKGYGLFIPTEHELRQATNSH